MEITTKEITIHIYPDIDDAYDIILDIPDLSHVDTEEYVEDWLDNHTKNVSHYKIEEQKRGKHYDLSHYRTNKFGKKTPNHNP